MESVLKKDPITQEVVVDDLDIPLFENVPGKYTPKTREQLNGEIEEGLTRESSFTSINFEKPIEDSVNSTLTDHVQNIESPANRTAVMGLQREAMSPLNEEDVRRLSVVESHEKGHVFRKLKPSQYLRDRFSQAFDLSKINPDTYLPGGRPEGATDEQIREAVQDYFNLSDPHELIERMSQLKGYFGMKGDEKFTPQHLEYAREHYLKDGMMDNNMQAFFDAITPEIEFAFLKLINSCGI